MITNIFYEIYSKHKTEEVWPKALLEIPRIGDLVESKDGLLLQVAWITHLEDEGQPFITITLSDNPETLKK